MSSARGSDMVVRHRPTVYRTSRLREPRQPLVPQSLPGCNDDKEISLPAATAQNRPSGQERDSPPRLKRDEYIVAGMRCIRRLGIRNSTMEEFASEAGVTRITLYREFGSREVFVKAVISYRSTAFNTRFARRIKRPRRLSQIIESYLLSSVRIARSNPVTRELVRGPVDFAIKGSTLHLISDDLWRPLVLQAIAKHEIAPDVDPGDVAQWVLLAQFTLCRLVIEAKFTAAEIRKLVQSFITPAFRPEASSR